MSFKPGDFVRKNPKTWVSNVADLFGRGQGVGVVAEPARRLYDGEVDVQWGSVRWFEKIEHLIAADAPNQAAEETSQHFPASNQAENR